jgi:hypothetical protein
MESRNSGFADVPNHRLIQSLPCKMTMVVCTQLNAEVANHIFAVMMPSTTAVQAYVAFPMPCRLSGPARLVKDECHLSTLHTASYLESVSGPQPHKDAVDILLQVVLEMRPCRQSCEPHEFVLQTQSLLRSNLENIHRLLQSSKTPTGILCKIWRPSPILTTSGLETDGIPSVETK